MLVYTIIIYTNKWNRIFTTVLTVEINTFLLTKLIYIPTIILHRYLLKVDSY